MAEAKKPTSRTSSTGRKTTKPKIEPEKVEDAVVIEETPAEPEKKPADDKPKAAEAAKPAAAPKRELKPAAEKPEADTKPEPKPAETKAAEKDTPPPPKPPAGPRRGGTGSFMALLLGGVAAAVIGFVAARTIVPDGWPFPGVEPEVDPLVAVVEGQAADLAALTDRLATLENNAASKDTLAAIQNQIALLSGRFDDYNTRLDEIEARLVAVEKLAPEGSEAAKAAAAAYERELAAMREMFRAELDAIAVQSADAGELEAEAAEASRAAAGRAALNKIAVALDAGQPFDAALTELTVATGITAPAALASVAETGVPTFAGLVEGFPPAARAALDAAIKAAVEDGSMSRVTAFFRNQLGTRSLEPREGDDADAVLSRAEAALKAGDIAGALAEVDALPEAAAPALADWAEQARVRQAALEASSALAQELNAK